MAATDVTPRCFCGRENIGCLGTSVLSVALQNVLLIGRGWKSGAGPKRYQFLPAAGSSEHVWKLTPDCELFWERRVRPALEISREIRSPPAEQHHSQSGATSSSSQPGSPRRTALQLIPIVLVHMWHDTPLKWTHRLCSKLVAARRPR